MDYPKARLRGAWPPRPVPPPRAALFALGLSLALVNSGCTLISVATLVGKRFAPALAKGNKKKLKHYSSRRLAQYWEAFTDKEIKAAVGADRKPQKGAKRAKRKKGPGIKLVSFKAKGTRAILKVRRGKQRFTFTCLYQHGRWRVHDVDLTMRGKARNLTRMLQLLVTAKTLQNGLQNGSRYLLFNVSTPRFRRTVLQRITDAELHAFASSGVTGGDRGPSSRKRKRHGAKITSEVHAHGATVSVTRTALPARIHLVSRNGQYWVDAVEMKLGKRWHDLGDLLSYVGPSLDLLRWVERNLLRSTTTGPPSDAELRDLVGRLRSVFSRSLWKQALGWLQPQDLKRLPWDTIRRALSPPRDRAHPAPRPRAKGPSLGPEIIQRFSRQGDRLRIDLRVGRVPFGLTLAKERGRWRIHNGWIQRHPNGKRLDAGALLAAFGPLAHLAAELAGLAPDLIAGGDRTRRALRVVVTGLKRVSSADLKRRFWSHIPPNLVEKLPVKLLPTGLGHLLRPGRTARGATSGAPGAHPAPRKAPHFDLGRIEQTAHRLRVELLVNGQSVRLTLCREADGWKLDDVEARVAGKPRSMKHIAALMVPAVALGHAVLSGDGQAFRQALSAPLRKHLADPLLHILGPRFKGLMTTLRAQMLPAAPAAVTPRPAPRPRPAGPAAADRTSGFKLLGFTHDVKAGRANLRVRVGEGQVAIALQRDTATIWRIADVQFPLMGRTVKLSRVGPVLAPVLGFGLSLLSANLRGVRRACSRSFNRSAWRKMKRPAFRKLVKTFTGAKKAAKRRPRRPPKRPTSAAKPQGPPRPRLVALRIRDRARWPWAEVSLTIGGRWLLVSLVQARGIWKVHDVKVKLGGLVVSIKKLIALGF